MKITAMTVVIPLTLLCAVGCNNVAPQTQEDPTSWATEEATPTEPETTEIPRDDINPPPDTIPELGTKASWTEEELRARLTPTQYRFTQEAGTERPHSGAYNTFKGDGMYHCSVCNAPLFTSDTKYDSGSGWPSFYTVLDGRTAQQPDHSGGMVRTEVICSHCGAHLGHIFEDGPDPTGLRYCVNSASIFFRPSDGDEDTESIE